MAGPFPDPYPTLLGDDPALGSALEVAIEEALRSPLIEHPLRVAISIAAIDETTSPLDFKHAGHRYGETFFSASLLKVAAMYAAFELRRSVNALAAGSFTSSELFALLHSEFDKPISEAVPAIAREPGLSGVPRRPNYEAIFTTIPLVDGGLACEFNGFFLTNLRRMMINSDNNAASACIQALGYSWINGTLHAGGFFFPPAQSGIWLAGTFTQALTAVRIPSANDGQVAQATTCFDMANLYAHIFSGTLVDQASSNDMLAILATSATVGDDPSYMDFTRRALTPRSFTVTHTKIGLGPLKTGQMVTSDGSIVEHGDSGRRFVVVWQNNFQDKDSLESIGFIVERTIQQVI
ncbi:serine hydrolase [Nonomuraea sp. NPDC050536]|uniref:serine hydrolase n=1 Tax=Nonomuraea sp. NPDC050536 TaxID=3364366 RepID=UPI0037C7D5CE